MYLVEMLSCVIFLSVDFLSVDLFIAVAENKIVEIAIFLCREDSQKHYIL